MPPDYISATRSRLGRFVRPKQIVEKEGEGGEEDTVRAVGLLQEYHARLAASPGTHGCVEPSSVSSPSWAAACSSRSSTCENSTRPFSSTAAPGRPLAPAPASPPAAASPMAATPRHRPGRRASAKCVRGSSPLHRHPKRRCHRDHLRSMSPLPTSRPPPPPPPPRPS
ncbi:atherin-like [Lethenteron reissneri]|uniref:atherin-like n=1 Tax=Lethenteron reissneri TaxID=7753 RepID=UPI002AB64292|nr:atherin-like [Lethenteron reissneri]